MSYYVSDENDKLFDNEELDNRYIMYDERQLKRFKRVMKELFNNWVDVIKHMMIYRYHNIDVNILMKDIIKIYFFNVRASKTYLKERKEALNNKKYRIQKLTKIMNIRL